MLLISDSDRTDVIVSCRQTEKGIVFEDGPESVKETFSFRKKNWEKHKAIMSVSMTVTPQGETSFDLFKLMDMVVKTLLADWTLKDEKGKKIPVTAENIDRLPPALMQHLFEKLKTMDASLIS